MFYVLPVEYILGKLPVVPVGNTGTIPDSMRQHADDFVGAAFDTRVRAGDGSRRWSGRANAARNEETSLPASLF